MGKRKIQVETDNSNWKAPKIRKKRKPMTEKQRVAADKDGNPKRDIGTYYPDMGMVYTQEMFNEDRGNENTKARKPRKRNTGTVEKKKRKSPRRRSRKTT